MTRKPAAFRIEAEDTDEPKGADTRTAQRKPRAVARTERIASGFYTSQAMEVTRS